MEESELRNQLTDTLSVIYERNIVAELVEFWQGELRILQYLYQHADQVVNPSILSNALGVSRARITTALSSLRNKNFIMMEVCENDRRRLRVILTGNGKNYVEQKQKEVLKQFDSLIRGMGEDNVIELIRLIELSIQVMEKSAVKS